ncbi:ScbR family autoregulator-binding transcription factor [Microbacterium lacticum]
MTTFDADHPSPKQDRAIATRAAILAAAAEAFISYGFPEATLAKIRKHSGLTNGALYHHFPTREALALAVVEEYEERFRTIIENSIGSSGESLRALIVISRSFAEGLQTDRLLLAGVILSTEVASSIDVRRPYQEWADHLEPLIRSCQESGSIRADIVASEVSTLFVSIFTGIQLFSAAASGRADIVDRVYSAWRILLLGLVPAEKVVNVLGLLDGCFEKSS